MMTKIFISCPMRGYSKEDILKVREDIKTELQRRVKFKFDVIDSYFPDFKTSSASIDPAVYCLGRAIIKMAEADMVVFCKGWEQARGCKIEYEIARSYNKPIIML